MVIVKQHPSPSVCVIGTYCFNYHLTYIYRFFILCNVIEFDFLSHKLHLFFFLYSILSKKEVLHITVIAKELYVLFNILVHKVSLFLRRKIFSNLFSSHFGKVQSTPLAMNTVWQTAKLACNIMFPKVPRLETEMKSWEIQERIKYYKKETV